MKEKSSIIVIDVVLILRDRLTLKIILHQSRSSENLEMKAFEKFENAVFFKIFKIPSDRQLIRGVKLLKIL